MILRLTTSQDRLCKITNRVPQAYYVQKFLLFIRKEYEQLGVTGRLKARQLPIFLSNMPYI